jgi:hypothetical protein
MSAFGAFLTSDDRRTWSLTSLKEKLIKIGAKVVHHGRYVILSPTAKPSYTPPMARQPNVKQKLEQPNPV